MKNYERRKTRFLSNQSTLSSLKAKRNEVMRPGLLSSSKPLKTTKQRYISGVTFLFDEMAMCYLVYFLFFISK